MKKQIEIGPIQRRKPNDVPAFTLVSTRLSKMKLGEFFEITGLDRRTALNFRASVSYYSKKEEIKVSTRIKGDTLTIERIRK